MSSEAAASNELLDSVANSTLFKSFGGGESSLTEIACVDTGSFVTIGEACIIFFGYSAVG